MLEHVLFEETEICSLTWTMMFKEAMNDQQNKTETESPTTATR